MLSGLDSGEALNFHRRGGNAAEIAGRESWRGGRNPFFALPILRSSYEGQAEQVNEEERRCFVGLNDCGVWEAFEIVNRVGFSHGGVLFARCLPR